jgi:hypothetical protein
VDGPDVGWYLIVGAILLLGAVGYVLGLIYGNGVFGLVGNVLVTGHRDPGVAGRIPEAGNHRHRVTTRHEAQQRAHVVCPVANLGLETPEGAARADDHLGESGSGARSRPAFAGQVGKRVLLPEACVGRDRPRDQTP